MRPKQALSACWWGVVGFNGCFIPSFAGYPVVRCTNTNICISVNNVLALIMVSSLLSCINFIFEFTQTTTYGCKKQCLAWYSLAFIRVIVCQCVYFWTVTLIKFSSSCWNIPFCNLKLLLEWTQGINCSNLAPQSLNAYIKLSSKSNLLTDWAESVLHTRADQLVKMFVFLVMCISRACTA